jgi:ABC-type transport system, involved in lipoprotein release, permease component
MLKNYFKIAIAVLRRRKFFTFITLFGISFTLAILMIITSFKDSLLSATYPETKRDRILYVNHVSQRNSQYGYTMNSEPSFSFIQKYIMKMHTPEFIGVCSFPRASSIYLNNKKLDLHIRYTNKQFWDVLDFNFLEGKPYTEQQINNSDHVTVISEEAKKQYFGTEVSAIGKYIEADDERYQIIGVVKDVPATMMYSYSEIYVPYTAPKSNYKNQSYQGDYYALLLAKSTSDIKQVQSEYQQIISKLKPEDPKNFNELSSNADLFTESFTRRIFGNKNDSGILYFYLIVGLFTLLFMLLPTINLVNINVSRIMERSSEIGVRKAFGASSSKLVAQFIFENIILTFLGGIIGLVIASIAITVFNHSNVIPNADLTINLRVLLYSILLCLVFGFISGVLPAWRMSRLNVVTALKTGS